jgi:xylose isomerase
MFIAHIGSMDTFAKGLRNAVYLLQSKRLPDMLNNRYKGWSESLGLQIENGKMNFEELESFVKKEKEPSVKSGKQGKGFYFLFILFFLIR